jgi:hypothetical protein
MVQLPVLGEKDIQDVQVGVGSGGQGRGRFLLGEAGRGSQHVHGKVGVQ